MQALMNAPKSMSVPGTTRPEMVSAPPPAITEMSGLMIFVVSAVTMDVNAPPMMTATAKSITLPRLMNSLNSLKNFFMVLPSFLCLRAHCKRSGTEKEEGTAIGEAFLRMICLPDLRRYFTTSTGTLVAPSSLWLTLPRYCFMPESPRDPITTMS